MADALAYQEVRSSRLPSSKILMTGMGGVLGLGLARSSGVPTTHELLVAGRTPPAAWAGVEFIPLDLSNPDEFAHLITKVQPTAILHGAAMARPAECEADPKSAWRINAEAVDEGMRAATQVGARMIFCSTDQVFDGLADLYAEDAPRNPVQVYGATKVAAEDAVLAAGGTVVRLPLLLGPQAAPGHMGADQALLLASQQGRSMGLFTDEIRAPADAVWLADPIWRLLLNVDLPAVALQPRIYHLAGSQAISRYEMGMQVCEAAGVAFEHGRSTLAEWQGVPRPPRLVLTCQRAQRELGFIPPDLRQSLAWVKPFAPE